MASNLARTAKLLIILAFMVRDQEVGGSNLLAPTILFSITYISSLSQKVVGSLETPANEIAQARWPQTGVSTQLGNPPLSQPAIFPCIKMPCTRRLTAVPHFPRIFKPPWATPEGPWQRPDTRLPENIAISLVWKRTYGQSPCTCSVVALFLPISCIAR